MNLPNSYFEDFPIEFKEINPSDFPGFEVENSREKIIIEPNRLGYINDAFQDKIDLSHKNTIVVNAAVGQGKSTAIIKTIGKYYHEHPNTVIIVASPFVSLVEQYCNDIHNVANIPQEQIYNYGNLGRDTSIDYKAMRVQVLTVNTLLGNPGEDAFKNSDIKRNYLNTLINHCSANNLKVVFIYDEIHDAIHNFKQEFIFSLWKWRSVILKNYILSATYNEASKVVIKYLAELTDKRIQIIESKRTVFPNKQSKLYLHYSPAHNFSINTPELEKVVKDLLRSNKDIDILCYSKKLAEEIINDNDGIGKLLKDRFGEVNNCTSELVSNQRTENEVPTNRYDNTKCNVGTNFKTGVSIKKQNHAYIIILPPRATRLWFRNKYGIFSGGINSIIQALARQRKKGEIHVVLPSPDRFDYESLNYARFSEQQQSSFQIAYDGVCHFNEEESKVKYIPLDKQDYLTLLFYKEKLHYNIHQEIHHIDSIENEREGLPSLIYPDYETFKLRDGEDYLANTYKFFGEDISAYFTYCAFTNQFINCKLSGMSSKTALFFEEDKIFKGLEIAFNRYFGEIYIDGYLSYLNFNKAYNAFRDELFGNYTLRFKKANSEKWRTISPYTIKAFESQLLKFVAHKYYVSTSNITQELEGCDVDVPYTRDMYLLECLSVIDSIEDETSSENSRGIMRLYQIIKHFRGKLIEAMQQHTSSSLDYRYLKRTMPSNFFNAEDRRLFEELISLLPQDSLLNNQTFPFKQGLSLKTLYTKLLHDFFVSEETRLPIGVQRPRIRKILEIKPIPENRNIIDLISESTYSYSEPTEDGTFLLEAYGSYENYLKEKEKINNLLNNL
jgi:hypothetical protein